MVERLRRGIHEHPVLFVFVLGLVVRVAAVAALSVAVEGPLFPDESRYATIAEQYRSGETAAWDREKLFVYEKSRAFIWLLSGTFTLTGRSLLAGRLLVAVIGAFAAALTTLLGRRFLPDAAAFGAGLAVAFVPSQIVWSSLVLKDPAVWTALVAVALGVSVMSGRRIVWGVLLAAGGLVALELLRPATAVVAALAVAIAGWFGRAPRRVARGVAALAIAVVVPLAFGHGPAGLNFVDRLDNLPDLRERLAEKSETSIVDEEPDSNLEQLPRGVSAVLLEPYPWQPVEDRRFSLARFEVLIVWYPLLVAGVLGLGLVWRRRAHAAFPALAAAGIVGAFALAEGNLGTAFRHRGQFVWAVALAAAAGVTALEGWRAARRGENEEGRDGERERPESPEASSPVSDVPPDSRA